MQLKDMGDTLKRKPLYVCKRCFDLNIKIPTSSRRFSKKFSAKEIYISKKQQMNKAVVSGKHKAQKN